MSSPTKENFYSIITEIVNKSKDIIIETDNILEYDAIEITLLLKSIGFRLCSLEFNDLPNNEISDIEIDIKCHKSGLQSKLILNNGKCSCPSRTSINNNSFWEVQGISSATDAKSKGLIQDTSCSLLPDISKNATKFSKAILSVLLQNFQIKFMELESSNNPKMIDVKQIIQRFQAKEASTMEQKKLTRSKSLSSSLGKDTNCELNANLKNTHCSTPLSSINVTPTPSYDGSMENILPRGFPNISSETVMNNGLKRSNSLTDTQSQRSNQSVLSLKDIKEKTFDKLSVENEKDIGLIQQIQEARKHLDTALLMLKCNMTWDNSGSSISSYTPKFFFNNNSLAMPEKISDISNRSSYLSAKSTTTNTPRPKIGSFQGRKNYTGTPLIRGNAPTSKTSNQILKSKDINVKKHTIGTPSSLAKSIPTPNPSTSRSSVGNVNANKVQNLAAKILSNNTVQPIIKRASSGTTLKPTSLAKPQLTKSLGKLSTSAKDTKK